MWCARQLSRFCTSVSPSSTKELLLKLRKKTGFSYINCKKALESCNRDLEKAEKWLAEKAKEESWQKAAKLADRKTVQGLVGVYTKNNLGTLVEVNCETDFVARSEEFKQLVAGIVRSCHRFALSVMDTADGPVAKWSVTPDVLGRQEAELFEGHSVAEAVRLSLLKFGENLSIGRNLNFKVRPAVLLSTYVHPRPTDPFEGVLLGHYGAAVAFTANETGAVSVPYETIGSHLCQHIIGMNPQTIGDPNKKPPAKEQSSAPKTALKKEGEESIINDDDEPPEEEDTIEQTELNNETELLHQSFLLKPEVTVLEFLKSLNLSVIDFARLELGSSSVVQQN